MSSIDQPTILYCTGKKSLLTVLIFYIKFLIRIQYVNEVYTLLYLFIKYRPFSCLINDQMTCDQNVAATKIKKNIPEFVSFGIYLGFPI